jgi:hypothetical protein
LRTHASLDQTGDRERPTKEQKQIRVEADEDAELPATSQFTFKAAAAEEKPWEKEF